jgi:hypothetical protein
MPGLQPLDVVVDATLEAELWLVAGVLRGRLMPREVSRPAPCESRPALTSVVAPVREAPVVATISLFFLARPSPTLYV